MTPLDDETKRMLADAAAETPSAAAEARIWRALSHSWDKPLPPTAAAASKATSAGLFSASGSALGVKLIVSTVLVSVGATAAVGWRMAQREPAAVAVVQPAVAPSADDTGAALVDVPQLAQQDTRERETTNKTPASSSLQAETRLIAEAQRALSRGMPSRALAQLDQHRTRFARGALTPEREAARVFALCALQRAAEVRQARQHFLQRWPDSPLASRVRASCIRNSDPD